MDTGLSYCTMYTLCIGLEETRVLSARSSVVIPPINSVRNLYKRCIYIGPKTIHWPSSHTSLNFNLRLCGRIYPLIENFIPPQFIGFLFMEVCSESLDIYKRRENSAFNQQRQISKSWSNIKADFVTHFSFCNTKICFLFSYLHLLQRKANIQQLEV